MQRPKEFSTTENWSVQVHRARVFGADSSMLSRCPIQHSYQGVFQSECIHPSRYSIYRSLLQNRPKFSLPTTTFREGVQIRANAISTIYHSHTLLEVFEKGHNQPQPNRSQSANFSQAAKMVGTPAAHKLLLSIRQAANRRKRCNISTAFLD